MTKHKLSKGSEDFLKVIAHPVRFEIAVYLHQNPEGKTVTDIQNHIHVQQSLTSQMLIAMRDKGLLYCVKGGSFVTYRMKEEVNEAMRLVIELNDSLVKGR